MITTTIFTGINVAGKKATSFVEGLLEQKGYTNVTKTVQEKREHTNIGLVIDYSRNSVQSVNILSPLSPVEIERKENRTFVVNQHGKTTNNAIKSGNKAAQKALNLLAKLEATL